MQIITEATFWNASVRVPWEGHPTFECYLRSEQVTGAGPAEIRFLPGYWTNGTDGMARGEISGPDNGWWKFSGAVFPWNPDKALVIQRGLLPDPLLEPVEG